MIESVFFIATIAAVMGLRRRWTEIRTWRHLSLVYPLGVLAWSLVAIVVLSSTVPRVTELPHQWGNLGKLLTLGALLVWPVAVVPTRAVRWVAGVLVVALSVLGLFDVAHVRHFGSLFPVTAFLGAGQGWDIRESIAVLLQWRDLWLMPTGLAGIAVAFGLPSDVTANKRNAWLARGIAGLLAVAGLGVVHHNLSGWRGQRILSHARWARHVGVFGVHVVDTARIIGEAWNREELAPERLDAVRTSLASDRESRPVPGEEHELFGVARGANVLVVQLESVQGFVIGAKVRGAEITPFLNSLEETAAYYPRITDQSGESNTADTEYLVNNSLHPMRQGALVFRRPDNHFVAWPQILANAGYTTLSAHPWDRGFWNRAVVHPKYGFERQLFRRELGGIVDKVGWGSSDEAFYERMVSILTDVERPFAAYLITLMSHHPYTFYPQERRELDMGDIEHTMLGSYLHLVHEVDASLRHFLEALDESGVLDNTLLVIFGDHDARLQTGADIDTSARELGMSSDEIQQLGHRDPRLDFVPLFIRLPGRELAGTVPVAGGQIDVGATILFFLGMKQPSSFLGRPLLPGHGFATRIDGSTLDDERFFVSQGVDVPENGLCLRWSDRTELPVDECKDLVERGEAQLRTSWEITELDMAPRL